MKPEVQRTFECLRDWLSAGEQAWLCTIVASQGASPRPVGSLLALNAKGEQVGSISGGCIEEELLEQIAAGKLGKGLPEIVAYGLTAEQNARLSLPCGGELKVMIEPCSREWLSLLDQLLESLSAREAVSRAVNLDSGEWTLSTALVEEGSPNILLADNQVRHSFSPDYRILLVGANELARCVAELAVAMNYQVLVCEPREVLHAGWAVQGTKVVSDMPDDALQMMGADQHTIVLTLTHDPRIDDMALMEALNHQLFYVGALGSIRTSAKRRERLLQLELSEQQIEKLQAPVGLPIGSKTPMEIAVAIMAELTSLRTGKVLSPSL